MTKLCPTPKRKKIVKKKKKKTVAHFSKSELRKLRKFIANLTVLDGGSSAGVWNSAEGRGFQKGSHFIS